MESQPILQSRARLEFRESQLVLNCIGCGGKSDLEDSRCRSCILGGLGDYPEARGLILNHYLIKEYHGLELEFLQKLAELPRILNRIKSSIPNRQLTEDCSWCIYNRISGLEKVLQLAKSDPYLGALKLREHISHLRRWVIYRECQPCFDEYLLNLEAALENLGEDPTQIIQSPPKFTRPSFCGFKLISSPPPNSELIGEIQLGSRIKAKVQVYQFQDRPERYYLIIPPEFQLGFDELRLLEISRRRLVEQVPPRLGNLESLRKYVRSKSLELLSNGSRALGLNLDLSRLEMLAEILTRHTLGLGLLEYLLEDESIQDIYINAPAHLNPIQILVEDQECSTNLLITEQELESMISKFRAVTGRPFSESSPIMDLSLEGYQTRISAIGAPLSPHGTAYSIRKHRNIPFTLPMLVSKGMISPEAAGLLSLLVDAQSSILITGDVGSGKTSLLGSLLFEIPQGSRIICIEDTPELPITQLQSLGFNIQSLITSPVTSRISAEFSPEMALRAALRFGNAVLVIGEVRGPEVRSLIEAMQIGAAGNCVLGTIHGSSAMAVYQRIVDTLGIPPKAFGVIDLIVVCSRTRIRGGSKKLRRVIQISEVRKFWESPEEIFNDLMVLNRALDSLEWKSSRSELIQQAAAKLGITSQEFQDRWHLKIRALNKLLELSSRFPSILEPEWVTMGNNMLRALLDRALESGEYHPDKVFDQWSEQLKSRLIS